MSCAEESWSAVLHFTYGCVRGGAPAPVGKIRVTLTPESGEPGFRIVRLHEGRLVKAENLGPVSQFELEGLLTSGQPMPIRTGEPDRVLRARVEVESWFSPVPLNVDYRSVTATAKKALVLLLMMRNSFAREIMVVHPHADLGREGGYVHRLVSTNGSIPSDVEILYVPPDCAIKMVYGTRTIRLHAGVVWEDFVRDLCTSIVAA
ncbi:MAG: hypothetical protein AAB384_03635 [Patescibacteria group bacterium]